MISHVFADEPLCVTPETAYSTLVDAIRAILP
jgi:hypothetical protein